jgi:hypothetical protein
MPMDMCLLLWRSDTTPHWARSGSNFWYTTGRTAWVSVYTAGPEQLALLPTGLAQA